MAVPTPVDLGGSNQTALTNSATVADTTTVAAASGDTIVVCVASSTVARAAPTVSDNSGVGNTWVADENANVTTANGVNTYQAHCQVKGTMAIGTVITATFPSSVSSVRAIAAYKIPGWLGASDLTVGWTGSTVSVASGATATRSNADEIMFVCGMDGTAVGATVGTGFTQLTALSGASRAFYVEYQIFTVTGTDQGKFTWASGSGTVWQAGLTTYKPSTQNLTQTQTATQAQAVLLPRVITKILVP